MDDPVTDYALKVLDGVLPAGPYVVWACERHMVDMQRDDLYLDLATVHRWIHFFRQLKHYKDEFYGRPLELALWQVFRVGSVMGWHWRATDRRRYRVAFNKVPRKNGKTTEMAGIGLGGLLIDGVQGAEVYSVATKSAQARIVFEDGQRMVGASAALRKRIKCFKTSMVYARAASRWMPLNRDSKTLDGLNPSLGLYDEFAMWSDYELRGKIRQGMGSRQQPLEWIVTTEGTVTESPCCDLTEHAVRVLDPEQPDFEDDTLFAYLACPFRGDDPGSLDTWARANPNLGVSKSVKYMEELWSVAQMMQSEMHDFLTYQLNVLVGSSDAWLDMDQWRAVQREDLKRADFVSAPCYQGLDLAEKHDLSAKADLFVSDDGNWYVFVDFWCPEEDIRRRAKFDKVPYDRWVKSGFLRATPGNATDFDFIEHQIREDVEGLDVRELLYDRWKSQYVVQNLMRDEVVTCVGYGQGYKDASPALKELERRLLNGTIIFAANPVLSWCASNALVVRDPSGNIKLHKKDDRKRIDGIAALMNAVGGALLNRPPEKKKSPYTKDRGMRSL